MSGIPYNELQSIECTAKDELGNDHTIATLHYAFVIPCRDCKHGIKADLSGNWYECMKPDGNGDYARWDVEPDGFCAWSVKRKEGGDD